jgi:hypothetical protein
MINMRNILIASVIAMAISCNNSPDNSTTSKTADTNVAAVKDSATDGWQVLFDGKTTNGWHSYGLSTVGTGWKTADGALYVDTTHNDNRDLVTNEEYENYDLKLEWKIAPRGNSGIIFNVKEDTTKYKHTYETGPEMQVIDNDGHADGKIKKHRAGDLYDLISSNQEPVKAVGEWNEAEIILNKGKLDFFLNGVNIVSTTMWDDNWKKMVAGSKFKSMAGFGTYTIGRIALQDHGNMVSYRNIRIKKL